MAVVNSAATNVGVHVFFELEFSFFPDICPGRVAAGRTQLSDFTLTFHFHALEKEMATHSSDLA